MKKLLIALALAMVAVTAQAQYTPPARAAFTWNGSAWAAASSTATSGATNYTPDAIALYCFNSGTSQWVPADSSCFGGGGGSGTVTSFSAGNLTPLFTTSVATATTTPALTFSLSSAAQNAVLAGPTSGSGAPTYRSLVAADIPTVTAASNLAGGALGSVPYQSAAGTTAFLAGTTSATPNFVTSTGTGSATQAPTLTASTGSGNVVLATGPTIATLTLTGTTTIPASTIVKDSNSLNVLSTVANGVDIFSGGSAGFVIRNQANNGTLATFADAGGLTVATVGITVSAGNLAVNAGTVKGTKFLTTAACASSASPAVCGANSAGFVVVAASATTVVVDTTAVTANSQIFLQEDSSLGTALSVTCNTTPATAPPTVSARTAGTSFTITTTAPTTNPRCFSYSITN